MAAAYANAGVTRDAAWVHETDLAAALRSRTAGLYARRVEADCGIYKVGTLAAARDVA
ncbi:MAG TPA: hypothetical protein VFI54_27455 [Solirubrobacteraceae bacterium]|nr:hypothetical protein [Solirubrobacteraceae bacterium]